jgi:multidrug efflux pump subunit AcrA (membrane-fusion protein)
VTRISPSADPNSRVFEVEAALPNTDGRLKVGMLASLRLDDRAGSTGIFVPLAAVVRPLGDTTGYAVYVIRDSSGTSSASLRRISLGGVSGNQIAVTGGLNAGERVIVRGSTLVADGQAVMVMP